MIIQTLYKIQNFAENLRIKVTKPTIITCNLNVTAAITVLPVWFIFTVLEINSFLKLQSG